MQTRLKSCKVCSSIQTDKNIELHREILPILHWAGGTEKLIPLLSEEWPAEVFKFTTTVYAVLREVDFEDGTDT